jgi:hypothetical protein
MTQIIYTDRSRSQSYLRCKRQRFLEYESGPTGKGIVPKKRSIHLVIGLAFHAGAEILLHASSTWLTDYPDQNLEDLFVRTRGGVDGKTVARQIEDAAVVAALQQLHLWAEAGIELDVQEQPEPGASANPLAGLPASSPTPLQQTQESAIIIDFADGTITSDTDMFAPTYPAAYTPQTEEEKKLADVDLSMEANLAQATGVDEYLKKELAALVEGMVRAYARRRLKPLLEEFEVLEVEREGSWKLGDIPLTKNIDDLCAHCNYPRNDHHYRGGISNGICYRFEESREAQELFWMSRHDGLLLERSTNQLYLLSYKTTGSWDRRKKQDAEIDMQGLSEAVDVEKRLYEAWLFLKDNSEIALTLANGTAQNPAFSRDTMDRADKCINERVSLRIAQWLSTLPAPPKILGVRYEYILKGTRRQDKKDPLLPGRYVQESPLIRAYLSGGITSEDLRWAPNYEWHSLEGKQRRVDYRSWRKAAVWEHMPVAKWIQMLDEGEYWPGKGEDFDEHGQATDVLADQFIPPVIVYRNDDDMRDWLEQVEAQEVGVALAASEVRHAKDEGETRSLLNRHFPQTRTACCWPGPCAFMKICYGGEDIRRDPLAHSDLYQIREANHPIEMAGGGG